MDKEEEMELLKELLGVMCEEELVRVRYRLRKVEGSERLVAVLSWEIMCREEGGRE